MHANAKVALILCWIGVLWFFRHDHKSRPNCSAALWITVLWMFFLGSHHPSFWLGVGGGGDGGDLDGNSFDRTFYLVVMGITFFILQRRGLNWGYLLRMNGPLVMLYLFLAVSIFWSAFPFSTFKRWFKEVGGIVVLLLPLTEKDPDEAIEAVYVRCAYVLLPLSLVFIKWVPALGRVYGTSGGLENVGVTEQKNSLGEIVMVFGLVILWRMSGRKSEGIWDLIKQKESRWPLAVLALGFYLLYLCDSRTAMICLAAGAMIVFSDRLPILRQSPNLTLMCFIFMLPGIMALNSIFPIQRTILHMMGRNETFTGRADIWHLIKEHPVEPLLGTGYLNYWDLHKVVEMDGYNVTLKTFHEGYIDMYADTGIVGCVVLGIMILMTGKEAARAFLSGDRFGKLQLAFFVITVFYNLSESVWARRGPLWCSFLLVCIGTRSIYLAHPHYQVEEESAPVEETPDHHPA